MPVERRNDRFQFELGVGWRSRKSASANGKALHRHLRGYGFDCFQIFRQAVMAELQVLRCSLSWFRRVSLRNAASSCSFCCWTLALWGVLAFLQQLDFTLDDPTSPASLGVFQRPQIAGQAQQLLLERLIVGAQLVESTLERQQLLDLALQRLKLGVALGDGLFDRLVQPSGLGRLILLPLVPEISHCRRRRPARPVRRTPPVLGRSLGAGGGTVGRFGELRGGVIEFRAAGGRWWFRDRLLCLSASWLPSG